VAKVSSIEDNRTGRDKQMRILIIGASKGTGALAVKVALDRGHEVTAFARSPEKLELEHPKLTKVKGDFHNNEDVDRAVPGHDAVIVTASAGGISSFKEHPTYFSQGTKLVIRAMKASGVRRLIVLSAIGVGETKKISGWIAETFLYGMLFKLPYADHERQEQDTRESGLEWVIARPARLTDGPATKTYIKRAGLERVPWSWAISRADVGDFLVEAAEVDKWVGKGVQLGG
jgi:putative NADH-flavin reductase